MDGLEELEKNAKASKGSNSFSWVELGEVAQCWGVKINAMIVTKAYFSGFFSRFTGLGTLDLATRWRLLSSTPFSSR